MTGVRAAADPAHPEGGHAIILLQGVGTPPPDPRFRILREGWAKGTLGPEGWQVGDTVWREYRPTAPVKRDVMAAFLSRYAEAFPA